MGYSKEYSEDLLKHMKPDDKVVYYQPLDTMELVKGCMSSSVRNIPGGGFIAVTERRLVIKCSALDDNGGMTSTLQTINVPISNVSSVTVRKKTIGGGCGSKPVSSYILIINVEGGFYNIYAGRTSQMADEFIRSFVDIQD